MEPGEIFQVAFTIDAHPDVIEAMGWEDLGIGIVKSGSRMHFVLIIVEPKAIGLVLGR